MGAILCCVRYVRLEYVPTSSLAEAESLLEESKYEFVEGIMYALDKILIIYGTMEDGADPRKVRPAVDPISPHDE
jgi:hypothetical protein